MTTTHADHVDTLLIDTDVHETLASRDLLLPYLEPVWQQYISDNKVMQTGATPPSAWPYAQPSAYRLDWIPPDEPVASTPELLRTQLLEGEGVSIAILNGLFYPSAMAGNFEFATALAHAYNDWQIEHWLDKEPSLRGSVHVVAHDPHVAAREIDRVAAHPQIVQVFLPTVTDCQYGDPLYRPIFEAAVRNDLVVTLHHGAFTQTVLGYPRYYFEWHTVAAPQAGINQLLSIVANGLFDRYPDLKVVLLETGVGWLPWFMWRVDEQYRESRSEVPWVKRLPSKHLRDNVRIATQPLGDVTPNQFVKIVEMAEADRMFMYSSDYPHFDADSADVVLPRSLPEALRTRVRYQNAVETYPRLSAAR